MTTKYTYQILNDRQRLKMILPLLFSLFIFVNIGVDFFTAKIQNYSFYFSESLLFSFYWLLFVPFAHLLLMLLKRTDVFLKQLLYFIIVVVIHLVTYPFLVWVISKIFYEHTFDYLQTFKFGLSSYFIKTLIIYGCSLIFYSFFKTQNRHINSIKEKKIVQQQQNYISSMLVVDNRKKVIINVNDIFYFSANSPYINIFHTEKKYLHTDTLKSLENRLNHQTFVRIHKSHIVNLSKIKTLQSRKNGDYDVTLLDNTSLRVSRNYVKNLKENFGHHLTIK